MNRLALLSFYRSIVRHKLYAAINIGGLAVGIGVFLVLGLYVRFETSYEKWLPEHEEIYLVRSDWKIPGMPFTGPNNYTMGGLLEQIQEDFPVVAGTRIRGGEDGGFVIHRGEAIREDIAQVDKTFLEVFDLPMVSGDIPRTFEDPAAALISERAARQYFGDIDPIGQMITIVVDDLGTYRVAGVFRDLPENTDFSFSIITQLPKIPPQEGWFNWGSSTLRTYLRFANQESAQTFEQAMPAFVDRRGQADMGENASDMMGLQLLPLSDVHLEPEFTNTASEKLTLLTLGLVGLFTLLIAVINYVNLATARSEMRAREVAMRKVLGADRATVARQFLFEAVFVVGLASLLGLILAELGLPLVNAAGGLALSIPYEMVIPALIVLTFAVGGLAGAYPALLISRYQPASVLASSRSPGGGKASARIREALVFIQFGLAIAFLIGTSVLVAQTQYVRSSDIGFERDGLMTVLSLNDRLVDPSQKRSFMAQAVALPTVRSYAMADTVVGGSGNRVADNVPLPGIQGDGPVLMRETVGPRFFEVYKPPLLAGRLFDVARAGDDSRAREESDGINIVINSGAVQALGFSSPQDAIGKTVGGNNPRTVIGVVGEMGFLGPREFIGPTYYVFAEDPTQATATVASLRFTGDAETLSSELERIWQDTIPQVPFDAETAAQRLSRFYEDDERATRLFVVGAGLAVLIGMVGLWGLASFSSVRRVKEIGIRKSLGASSTNIVTLLIRQFLRPVLLANLLAWPLAYFAASTWLAGFADRINLSPLYFIGASFLAVIIAILTVFGQTLRASQTPPAWALRHD